MQQSIALAERLSEFLTENYIVLLCYASKQRSQKLGASSMHLHLLTQTQDWLLALLSRKHIKLHILIHYSQITFGGRRSRQLLHGSRSALHHLAKTAKHPKERLCSNAREKRPGKQDFELLGKKNYLFNQLSNTRHSTGAHQKFPHKASLR